MLRIFLKETKPDKDSAVQGHIKKKVLSIICFIFQSKPWFFTWINLNLIEVLKSSVSGTVSSCLFLWSFLSCHYFFYPVMKSWETFFMLNFIYFHFQIAIVKVLHEIRLLSGKSYWKYGCK